MGAELSILRQHLHSALLQAHGSDQTMVRVRKVLGQLIDDVQRAENGHPAFSFAFIRQMSTPPQTYRIAAINWSFKGKLVGYRPFER
jgi:hypothetical protein